MKKSILPLLILLCAIFSCQDIEKSILNDVEKTKASSEKTTAGPRPPGEIVAFSAASTGLYLGSPSICAFSDGTLYASCELHGANSANAAGETVTRFYKYEKNSSNVWKWVKKNDINGQAMSNLFEHNSKLYIMGVSKAYGKVIIRQYNSANDTWTNPTSSTTGILKDNVGHHTAATPVVSHGGRLWRAMEDTGGSNTLWPSFIRPFMMSADANANLLHASSWKVSPPLSYNSTYLNGYFKGWLEGNALPVGNQMYNILRVFTWSKVDERAAYVKVNITGTVAANNIVMTNSFDSTTGFNTKFPGSHKKFTIRYDSNSGKYLTISNYIPADQYDGVHITSDIRNTLALCSSTDLINWRVDKILMQYKTAGNPASDKDYHAFQYADWVAKGNDLHYVVRTAFDDDFTGANSYHNANYITYDKLANYKTYTNP
jgi:hypothetical protein